MPYVGKKPADIIATAIDTTTGTFSGVVDADAGITVDNITIDGTEIDLSSGDLTIDVAGNILLDADGGTVKIVDNGTNILQFANVSNDVVIQSLVSDKDLIFKGQDSGSTITALTLDMSDGGTAIFNHDISLADNSMLKVGAGNDLALYHDGTNSYIDEGGTGKLYILSNQVEINNSANSEVMIKAVQDGAVELYHNGSKKFETTSTGATVTGNVATDTLSVGTTSTNGTFTITGSIVARETDGQFELISRDTSGSASTDYGDFIFKGQRSVDGDTTTIMTLDGGSGAVAITGATSIGTSTPDGLLTLEGTSNPLARFTHTQNADEVVLICQHTYATGSQPASMIQFRDAGGTVRGSIQTTGSATAYITSSDYRLKENVVTEWDATTRLKQLKPSRFNFIEDADNTVDGFLAHEVSSIVPEAITGDKDGTRDVGTIKDEDNNVIKENALESEKKEKQTWEKTGTENVYQGIDQAKLVPLLVKTIQELEARITALESA